MFMLMFINAPFQYTSNMNNTLKNKLLLLIYSNKAKHLSLYIYIHSVYNHVYLTD